MATITTKDGGKMTESEKKGIAENYIKALANRDAALMTSITTGDSLEYRWDQPCIRRSERSRRHSEKIRDLKSFRGVDQNRACRLRSG